MKGGNKTQFVVPIPVQDPGGNRAQQTEVGRTEVRPQQVETLTQAAQHSTALHKPLHKVPLIIY